MVSQVFNNLYTTCTSYSNTVIDFSKPIVDKVAEIAKKCFDSIGRFALGFCVGTLATTCYIIFQTPPMGYSLNLNLLAVYAVFGGIVLGLGAAISAWREETV